MACIWSEQEDGWETSCGELYCIIDGTPEENRMKFCTFCGEEIEQELAKPLETEPL